MKRLVAIGSIATALALGTTPSAVAHHSHSMFDMTREVTITGTVSTYSYRNPHVFLHIEVKGDKNETVSWAVEMSNISNMQNRGVFASTFRVGDTVTVKLNPLKDGRFGGNYTSVTAADGKVYE